MTAVSGETSATSAPSATLTIDGRPQPGFGASYPVRNPARPAEIVGYAPSANLNQLDTAVHAAPFP